MTAARTNDTMIPPISDRKAHFSTSLPTTATILRRPHPKRGRHHTTDKESLLSASIPLPKSHIHRTPSELQLADDVRRAEYEDVRMYARLVVGMQSQCMVSGYVHPLTKKSLQDILKTKQANEDELGALHEEDADEWELSYNPEEDDEDAQDENSVDTPLPCHPMGVAAKAPSVVKTPSDGSLVSNLSNVPPPDGREGKPQDSEDGCMFSLDL